VRLEAEYAKKLEGPDYGTVYELAVLGRLLQKGSPFSVDPWPVNSQVDAYLRGNGLEAELEIKASLETLYEKNVRGMCDGIKKRIESRWPRFVGTVHLCNPFREKTVNGINTLDADRTSDDVMEELDKAIEADGTVRPTYRDYTPFRRVTIINPGDVVRVWHSSTTLSAAHEEDVLTRVLKRSLDDHHQFSRARPALLAIVLARDPDARPLYRDKESPAETYFRKHPHLSAIIAIPCPSINGTPTVLRPTVDLQPTRTFPLDDGSAEAIAEFFACKLQVSEFWERVCARLGPEPLRLEDVEGEDSES
jgi:hypothetical protein